MARTAAIAFDLDPNAGRRDVEMTIAPGGKILEGPGKEK
jgi:hypothetical protein